jgi:hypothetical protein
MHGLIKLELERKQFPRLFYRSMIAVLERKNIPLFPVSKISHYTAPALRRPRIYTTHSQSLHGMMGLPGAGEAQVAALPWMPLLACAVLAWCALRALEWAWWRPRRLGRELRSQGLRGTEYRSLAGDAPLMERLSRDARSRPMPLGCHDVVPRAMPMFHQTMKEHGASFLSFMWAPGLNPCIA